MRLLISFLVIGALPVAVVAADPVVGQRVFAKPGAVAMVGSEKIDIRKISFPAVIGDVNGDWLWLGRGWVRKSDVMLPQDALDYYSEQIRQKPNDASLWAGRGAVWYEQNRHDEAIKDYSEAIRLNPQLAVAYNNRGNAWRQKFELDNSFKDFSEAIRIDPLHVNAYVNRALAWYDKGVVDGVITDATEAIRLDPQMTTAYTVRGLGWEKSGDLDAALEDYMKAITLDQKYAFAYRKRGHIYRMKGDLDSAIADYSIAIRLDPNPADVCNAIAWDEATSADDRYRDGKTAVEYATKACELSSWKVWNYLGTLAAAQAESGDFATAVKWAEKSVELAPEREKKAATERLELYRINKPYREPPAM